jgi:AraC-like DNA-binding protein
MRTEIAGDTVPSAGAVNPSVVNDWLATCVRQMEGGKSFATGGAEVAHRHILDITRGRCVFSVRDPSKFFGFGACEVALGGTSIRFLRWDCDTDCEKITNRTPDRHRVILHYVLRGEFDAIQGEQCVHVRPGEVLVVGARGSTIKRWHGACELLIVSFARDALTRALADELGIDATLSFDGLSVVDLAEQATLARFVATVVSDLSETPSVFAEPKLALQAERTLHLLFLKSLARRYLATGTPPAQAIVPAHVRRAERYMRDNLSAQIDMPALTTAAGVSARTLQYAFKAYRDVTPMRDLKNLRLNAARAALLNPQVRGRIAEVAADHGFVSVAHFSRDYRAAFGENPSDTVRSR